MKGGGGGLMNDEGEGVSPVWVCLELSEVLTFVH